MKYDSYTDLIITNDYSIFGFISHGKNGSIPKRIVFSATELDNIYNLAFGDINEEGEIDDYCISDNGDRNKILATVAKAVDDFTEKYPDRWVLFRGSTPERNRLYRMAIGLNQEEIAAKFDIYVYVENQLVPFIKNLEINTFIIKRKII